MLTDLLEVVLRELGWNLAAFALTGIVSVLVMRFVFGLRLVDVVREVEDEHNAAVGAAFFTVALMSGLWFGKIGGDFSIQASHLIKPVDFAQSTACTIC